MENMVMRTRLVNFYQGKRVFLTGHTGFKGSWFLALLHQLGAEVKGYSLEFAGEDELYPILKSSFAFESITADIRDKEKLTAEILSFKPDVVFHLAAQSLVRRSYRVPSDTFDVNVVGTASLLEAITHLENPCQVVIITTDKVYENKEASVYYTEQDVLGGYDPYSASKACAELVVHSFRKSFFNPDKFAVHHKSIAAARAGNVIGGGDRNEDRLIPDLINALSGNQAIPLRFPGAVRPWQHVLEPLTGYLLLGTHMAEDPVKYAAAYNFGPLPGDHLTVQQVVELSIKLWGRGSWEDHSSAGAPHEAGLLMLNIDKAMAELKWRPKLNAEQAVAWTVEWYQKPLSEKLDYTYTQIRNFLHL